MVHVQGKEFREIIESEDNSSVKCDIITAEPPMNYGDDDCIKMVSNVYEAKIHLTGEIAKEFIKKNIQRISSIRYDYYNPAYAFWFTNQTVNIISDDNVEIIVTK